MEKSFNIIFPISPARLSMKRAKLASFSPDFLRDGEALGEEDETWRILIQDSLLPRVPAKKRFSIDWE